MASFALCFLMDFLLLIPAFLSHYVFSMHFFEAWVIISFIWVFSSAVISVVLPIWKTRGIFKEFGSAV
jgi:urea-proton symporter